VDNLIEKDETRFIVWWRRWVMFLWIVLLSVSLIGRVGVGMTCFKTGIGSRIHLR
jgi:hypothetical protein